MPGLCKNSSANGRSAIRDTDPRPWNQNIKTPLASLAALLLTTLLAAGTDAETPAPDADTPAPDADTPAPDANATIRAVAGQSEIVIKTTARTAGAIDSLTWNGREFINTFDHGRQLQSASNLDCGTPITAETFNPTEAGSRPDGRGANSTSVLLNLRATGHELETTSRMAFWLAPGQKSGTNLAKNTTLCSEHLLTKRVKIGYKNLPNVIAYDVTFTVPPGEWHTHSVFEALTGYMPPEFSEFLKFNPKTGNFETLSDGPGEIPEPVVLAVPGGSHAMGIYAPPQPAPNTRGPTFGRFRFVPQKVVKWNCVFRVTDKSGLKPGEYSYHMFVIVGDLKTVHHSMQALHREFEGAPMLSELGR